MAKTNIALYTIDIIALAFLYGLLFGNNLLNKSRKRSFAYGILMTILIILAEVGTNIVGGGDAHLRGLNILFNLIGFALTPTIPIILIVIFNPDVIKKNIIILLPLIINIIVVLLSPIYGLIFYVDQMNQYTRGSIFYVFVAVYIVNIILLVVGTIWTCNKSFYPIKWKLISLSLFTVAGSFIQLLLPEVYASWHCVTLSFLLFYILLSEFDGSFDTLTQLYNRAAFERAIKQLTDNSRFSIIALDINDFKTVNDTHGHSYGDTVLQEVSNIIRESFNHNSSWYRIGGDEFCIISKDTDQNKLETNLKKLTEGLSKERFNNTCLPTIAYGYSIHLGAEPLNFRKMMEEADKQMYFYKQIHKEEGYQTK